jgi:preprotein translocase subunit SecE
VNKQLIPLVIWAAVIAVTFIILWRKGYVQRLRNYILETREELRKCTWPSWNELKGSTLVVMITIALLGGFTIGIDFLILNVVRWITRV